MILEPGWGESNLLQIRIEIEKIHLAENLYDYVLDLLKSGRRNLVTGHSLSPRSGRDLVQTSKVLAWLRGRNFVIPEDIQELLPFIWGHRIGAGKGLKKGMDEVDAIIKEVPLP